MFGEWVERRGKEKTLKNRKCLCARGELLFVSFKDALVVELCHVYVSEFLFFFFRGIFFFFYGKGR